MNKLFPVLLLLLHFTGSFAQEKEPKKYVQNSFGSDRVISLPTAEFGRPGSWALVVQHRFGKTDVTDAPFYNLLGMDLSSNIRLGFTVPVTQRLFVGVGRTKYNKTFDAEAKYIVLKQTKNNTTPFSLGIYGNVAYRSADFPNVGSDYYFTDSTAFAYEDIHRLSYSAQFIISRQFTRWLAIQTNPMLVYRNLVDENEENLSFALPVAAKLKTGLFSGVVIEYAHTFETVVTNANLFSVGYEIKTASHEFQIFVSSNNKILNQYAYSSVQNVDLTEGQFYLGFNLNRRFWYKKNKK